MSESYLDSILKLTLKLTEFTCHYGRVLLLNIEQYLKQEDILTKFKDDLKHTSENAQLLITEPINTLKKGQSFVQTIFTEKKD